MAVEGNTRSERPRPQAQNPLAGLQPVPQLQRPKRKPTCQCQDSNPPEPLHAVRKHPSTRHISLLVTDNLDVSCCHRSIPPPPDSSLFVDTPRLLSSVLLVLTSFNEREFDQRWDLPRSHSFRETLANLPWTLPGPFFCFPTRSRPRTRLWTIHIPGSRRSTHGRRSFEMQVCSLALRGVRVFQPRIPRQFYFWIPRLIFERPTCQARLKEACSHFFFVRLPLNMRGVLATLASAFLPACFSFYRAA